MAAAIEQWHLLPTEHSGGPAEARMAAEIEGLAPADRVRAEALLFRLLVQNAARMVALGFTQEYVVGMVRESPEEPDRRPTLRVVPTGPSE